MTLEERVAQLERRVELLEGRPARVPQFQPIQRERRTRERQSVSEGTIGRYVLGTTALLLTVVATGLFIAACWDILPFEIWMLIICFIGFAVESLGVALMPKSTFWAIVAGTGAAVALIGGCASGIYIPVGIWLVYQLVVVSWRHANWLYVYTLIGCACACGMFSLMELPDIFTTIFIAAICAVVAVYPIEGKVVSVAGPLYLLSAMGFASQLTGPYVYVVILAALAYIYKGCSLWFLDWKGGVWAAVVVSVSGFGAVASVLTDLSPYLSIPIFLLCMILSCCLHLDIWDAIVLGGVIPFFTILPGDLEVLIPLVLVCTLSTFPHTVYLRIAGIVALAGMATYGVWPIACVLVGGMWFLRETLNTDEVLKTEELLLIGILNGLMTGNFGLAMIGLAVAYIVTHCIGLPGSLLSFSLFAACLIPAYVQGAGVWMIIACALFAIMVYLGGVMGDAVVAPPAILCSLASLMSIFAIRGMLLSLAGCALMVGLIVVGFARKNKPLRLAALTVLMLCITKACTFDIYQSGNLLVLSGGIAATAVICFGLSALYYVLNKRWEEEVPVE